eukprot:3625467-Pyramimonas_sp.AAC.1
MTGPREFCSSTACRRLRSRRVTGSSPRADCHGTRLHLRGREWTRRRCRIRPMLHSMRSRTQCNGRFIRTLQVWKEDFKRGVPQQLAFMTWSTRALLHQDMGLRTNKFNKLREFCKNMSIVALQEVHGTKEELRSQLYLRRMGMAIVASIPEHAAGGVAFVLPEMTQKQIEEELDNERIRFIPGRAQRLAIKARGNFDRSDTMLVF